MMPKTSMGIANADILIFKPRIATNQAVVVVPMLAPKIRPTPWVKPNNPVLIKEMVITEIKELD